jgi:hypothetical protein
MQERPELEVKDMKIEGTGVRDAYQVTLYLKELVDMPSWAIDAGTD